VSNRPIIMSTPKNPARNAGKKPEPAKSKGPKPLNVREERFAENIAAAMKGGPAAKKAGYKGTPDSLNTMASRLLRKVEVAERIAQLRAKTSTKLEFSRENLANHLFAAATTPVSDIHPGSPLSEEYTIDSNGKTRIKGMSKVGSARLLCEMMGWKEPEQLVVETGPKTLEALEERAKNVVSALDRRMRKPTA
jgi:hypothetical protein